MEVGMELGKQARSHLRRRDADRMCSGTMFLSNMCLQLGSEGHDRSYPLGGSVCIFLASQGACFLATRGKSNRNCGGLRTKLQFKKFLRCKEAIGGKNCTVGENQVTQQKIGG